MQNNVKIIIIIIINDICIVQDCTATNELY